MFYQRMLHWRCPNTDPPSDRAFFPFTQALLTAAMRLSEHLQDLPLLPGPEDPPAARDGRDRDLVEYATHLEKEMARVQHVLALVDMPADLVVEQYCVLLSNPTQAGMAWVRVAAVALVAPGVEWKAGDTGLGVQLWGGEGSSTAP